MGKISEIALFQQSETYALVVETRTTVKEIAMTIGRSFMEIETLFKEQNSVMADVPFVEYLNFESMSEDIHMVIGFIVEKSEMRIFLNKRFDILK